MESESESQWRPIFENWPVGLPRQGVLTTTFQESIPFADFRFSNGLLLVERDRPDSLGARKVMLPYSLIAALKLTDTGELSRYQVMGFDRNG
jgi:hypothetical protein